jgi:hypothetical protein
MGFSYLIRYTIHIFSAGGCYQLQVREYAVARYSSAYQPSHLAWRFSSAVYTRRLMEQMAASIIMEARRSIPWLAASSKYPETADRSQR